MDYPNLFAQDTVGKAKGKQAKPNGHAGTIRVRLGELPLAVAESNAMLAANSRKMFILGDLLVTVEEVDGIVQTVPATPIRIGLELARVAKFERAAMGENGPEWRTCDPPGKLSAAIASEPGGWLSPPLAGLVSVPILRPDGSVITTQGYDKASKLYLNGGPFEPIGGNPLKALDVLKDALCEFVFVSPHHRSGALALLLTSVCRRVLSSAPLFGISATEAGTGKGTLAALAGIMATGWRVAEQPWPGNSVEEQRKLITSALLSGNDVLILDNITDPLDSAPLCVVMTAGKWSDRMLGVNRIVLLPASILAIANGNNLSVVGDLCRRVLPIEMDANCESPELRAFGREFLPWALENRGRLVAAALTVLSCYIEAGSPLPDDFSPLGSFEEWSRLICGSLVWLGEPDPRKAMEATRSNDPKRLLLSRFMTGYRELFGVDKFGVGTMIESASASYEYLPTLQDAIDEITIKARADDVRGKRIMLGRWLESHRGRVIDKCRLVSERDAKRKMNLWRVAGSDDELPAD